MIDERVDSCFKYIFGASPPSLEMISVVSDHRRHKPPPVQLIDPAATGPNPEVATTMHHRFHRPGFQQ